MLKELYNKITNNNNLTVEENVESSKLEELQQKFLNSNIGKAINGGIDIALKIVLPDCVEDEIIEVKDSLITEGFSAAVETAVEEATNLGKSALGIITGSFENISQIKKAIEKGGLIDSVSDLINTGVDWAKKNKYISSSTASTIKKGNKTITNTIKDSVDNSLEDQVESLEKIDGYIDKWYQYFEEKNFQNMEYQYEKIKEYIQEVIPMEDTLKKARTVENLHELIKNNGKNFELTEEEKELAEMLSD